MHGEIGLQIHQLLDDVPAVGAAIDIVPDEDQHIGFGPPHPVSLDHAEKLVEKRSLAVDVAYRVDPAIGRDRSGGSALPWPNCHSRMPDLKQRPNRSETKHTMRSAFATNAQG